MPGIILYLTVTAVIIAVLLKWSRFFDVILKTGAGIILILVFINLIPIVFTSYYQLDAGTSVMVYEKPNRYSNYSTVNIPEKHLLAKQGKLFYKYYGFSSGLSTGYVYYNAEIDEMPLNRSILMRLLLTSPVFILLIIIFGTGYRPGMSDIYGNIMNYRERLYVDGAVIREIRDLRTRIEDMRVDKETFDSIRAELNKVKEKTSDIEVLKDVKNMEIEVDRLVVQYGLGEDFTRKLLTCRDFIEESLLRLDYDDYRIAIQVFNEGMRKRLKARFETQEEDYRELIMYAFRSGVIDIDKKQDLLWVMNLDAMALKERLGAKDKARVRLTIENCSKI